MHRIEEISDSSMMNAVVPADSSQVRLPPALADRIFYLEAQVSTHQVALSRRQFQMLCKIVYILLSADVQH